MNIDPLIVLFVKPLSIGKQGVYLLQLFESFPLFLEMVTLFIGSLL